MEVLPRRPDAAPSGVSIRRTGILSTSFLEKCRCRMTGLLDRAGRRQPGGNDVVNRWIESKTDMSAGNFKIDGSVACDAVMPVHDPVAAGINRRFGHGRGQVP